MRRTLQEWMVANQFFPESNKFIFQQLVNMHGTAMGDIGITHSGGGPQDIDTLLDIQYMYQISNQRKVSSFFDRMTYPDTPTDPASVASRIMTIADLIYFKYYNKWKKLYNLTVANYNPLHNYDMTEHEEINTYVENTRNVDNNVFGFNTSSTDGVPQSKGTQSDIVDGDKTNNYSDHTKSGNIGVTTTQKMFEEEIEVRKYNFYNQMFEDINNEICLKVW